MVKTNEGLWKTVTDKAKPGQTYLYLIDDYHGKQMLRTDPVSFSVVNIPEVNQVQSVVHDETVYQWGDQNWMRQRTRTDPLRSPLSIYEMQPKSWKSGTYQSLNFRQIATELATYCQKMGFTHVEMYGVLEHAHQGARGYQVANLFAPYRDSGRCDDLKYLIDHLHQHGIGVILDWIPAHFQHYHQSHSFSMSVNEFDGTNLFASSSSPWGTLYFDFDKEETRRLLFASALYYIDRLHIDGIRFDAVSSMIRRKQTDIPGAISFLRELNHTIHTYYPGVVSIAEETEGYPNLTKIMGFDLKWNIGWSYDARSFLRTPYAERTQHWKQKILDMFNWAR
jgi:1,4-alpha-glucan branching enzyme